MQHDKKNMFRVSDVMVSNKFWVCLCNTLFFISSEVCVACCTVIIQHSTYGDTWWVGPLWSSNYLFTTAFVSLRNVNCHIILLILAISPDNVTLYGRKPYVSYYEARVWSLVAVKLVLSSVTKNLHLCQGNSYCLIISIIKIFLYFTSLHTFYRTSFFAFLSFYTCLATFSLGVEYISLRRSTYSIW